MEKELQYSFCPVCKGSPTGCSSCNPGVKNQAGELIKGVIRTEINLKKAKETNYAI